MLCQVSAVPYSAQYARTDAHMLDTNVAASISSILHITQVPSINDTVCSRSACLLYSKAQLLCPFIQMYGPFLMR